MNETQESPAPVNIVRRTLAGLLFIPGMFLLILCMPWLWKNPKVDRFFRNAYDWLAKTTLKINPNFDD